MTSRRIPLAEPTGALVAPVLPRLPGSYSCHVGTVRDPYFGLRNLPKTALRTVVADEKRYMKAYTRKFSKLKRKMAAETKIRGASHPTIDTPVRYGDMYLFNRVDPQDQYPCYYVAPLTIDIYALMKDDLTDCRKVLDVNTLAKSRGAMGYEVGTVILHDDGETLAYTECADGSEKYHIVMKNLVTGRERKGTTGISEGIEFLGDDILALRTDAAMRPYQIIRVATDDWSETVIHEELDTERYLAFEFSKDNRWLLVHSGTHDSTRAYAYKVAGAARSLRLTSSSSCDSGVCYTYAAYGTRLALLTGTEDGVTIVTDPQTGNVLVPSRDGYQIESITLVKFRRDRTPRLLAAALHDGEYVVESWSNGVCTPITVTSIKAEDTSHSKEAASSVRLTTLGIGTPAPASVILCLVDDRTDMLAIATTTWTTPDTFHTVNPYTFQTTLLFSWPVEGYDASQYEAIRLTVPARDGTLIPCSLIHKVTTPLGAPTLAYAYAAYGEVFNGWFSESRVSLLNRGVMFLLIHARGGGDFGRQWHTAGRADRKMNTFTDIHDTVLTLKNTGVIGEVVLRGGSAGGSTVTVAANLDVEAGTHLYAAVIAEVPFVDALATMSDATLPLTIGEYGEWGNPQTEEGYNAIAAWNPLSHIQRRRYPNFFIACGVNDPRVGYWEALKLAARLRTASSRNHVIVRMDVGAGHGGASGRFDSIDQETETLAYALIQLGVTA